MGTESDSGEKDEAIDSKERDEDISYQCTEYSLSCQPWMYPRYMRSYKEKPPKCARSIENGRAAARFTAEFEYHRKHPYPLPR